MKQSYFIYHYKKVLLIIFAIIINGQSKQNITFFSCFWTLNLRNYHINVKILQTNAMNLCKTESSEEINNLVISMAYKLFRFIYVKLYYLRNYHIYVKILKTIAMHLCKAALSEGSIQHICKLCFPSSQNVHSRIFPLFIYYIE